MRVTFHRLFWMGVTAIPALLVLATIWSVLSTGGGGDWLQDGRYVVLTDERYPPGSVAHFAFDEWKPPRPVGFFLIVGPDGVPVALFDRVGGCRLQWREDRAQFVDRCRGRVFALERVRAGDRFGGDLVYLPVIRSGGRLRIDLAGVLPGG